MFKYIKKMIVTSRAIRSLLLSQYRKPCYFLNCPTQIRVFGYQKANNFHCTNSLNGKIYRDYENEYAYGLMEGKGYAHNFSIQAVPRDMSTITQEEMKNLLNENWSDKSPQQIFEVFSKLGTYCTENKICISNKMFDTFIDNLTDNIKLASDMELVSLFNSLRKWPETESVRTRNYIEVWVALDEECLKRIQSWTFDEMLPFVSLFFMLNVTRVSDFTKKCLQKMASKAKQLTPGQLIQALFFIGVMRRQPFDMHNLEVHLDNNFDKFTVDDLAIMSMGFFKSKTPIRSMELLSKIVDKTIENSHNINEVSLAALLKVIRYSMRTANHKIYELLDTLKHEVPRLSIMCNVHIALVGASTLTLHKECLTIIAETVSGSISETRMKDLERLILTYGTFNFKPPTKKDFFNIVIEELRKPERYSEIEYHGRCFALCVAYLGLLNIYPVDLMSKVLCPSFLQNTYGKQIHTYGKEILTVHNLAEIFCRDADMNRLSEETAKIMAKKYTDYVPEEDYAKQYNLAEKFFMDVHKIIREDRGNDYVIADHILTHHQRGGNLLQPLLFILIFYNDITAPICSAVLYMLWSG